MNRPVLPTYYYLDHFVECWAPSLRHMMRSCRRSLMVSSRVSTT